MDDNQDAPQVPSNNQGVPDPAVVDLWLRASLDAFGVDPGFKEHILAQNQPSILLLMQRINGLLSPHLTFDNTTTQDVINARIGLLHNMVAIALIHASWTAMTSTPHPLGFAPPALAEASSPPPPPPALAPERQAGPVSLDDAVAESQVEVAMIEAGTPEAGRSQVIADHRLIQSHHPGNAIARHVADLVATFDSDGEFVSQRGLVDRAYIPSGNRERLANRLYLAVLITGRCLAEWDRLEQGPPAIPAYPAPRPSAN